jgi:hypothetical protein
MSSSRRRAYSVRERPTCPKHGDTMNAGSSQVVTYYYCQIAGCSYSDKAGRFYNDVNESTKRSSHIR